MRDRYVLAYLRFVHLARPWYSMVIVSLLPFGRAATSFQDIVISTKDVRVLCKHTGAGSAEWNVGYALGKGSVNCNWFVSTMVYYHVWFCCFGFGCK